MAVGAYWDMVAVGGQATPVAFGLSTAHLSFVTLTLSTATVVSANCMDRGGVPPPLPPHLLLQVLCRVLIASCGHCRLRGGRIRHMTVLDGVPCRVGWPYRPARRPSHGGQTFPPLTTFFSPSPSLSFVSVLATTLTSSAHFGVLLLHNHGPLTQVTDTADQTCNPQDSPSPLV